MLASIVLSRLPFFISNSSHAESASSDSQACFNGAHLRWSKTPPPSLYETFDYDEEGGPIYGQVHYPPFDAANLNGTSFENVHFENADSRNANNVALANFKGATGLDTCIFGMDAMGNNDLRLANLKFA